MRHEVDHFGLDDHAVVPPLDRDLGVGPHGDDRRDALDQPFLD